VFATGITPAELTWDDTYQHADGTPRIPSIPGHEVSGVVESDERLVSEVADVIFHSYVLLAARGLELTDVEAELARALARRRFSVPGD
jgi:NADPH:quinone reductase-like Zn-dependent oxidoreductase